MATTEPIKRTAPSNLCIILARVVAQHDGTDHMPYSLRFYAPDVDLSERFHDIGTTLYVGDTWAEVQAGAARYGVALPDADPFTPPPGADPVEGGG